MVRKGGSNPATARQLLLNFAIATPALGLLIWLTRGLADGQPFWVCLLASALFSALTLLLRALVNAMATLVGVGQVVVDRKAHLGDIVNQRTMRRPLLGGIEHKCVAWDHFGSFEEMNSPRTGTYLRVLGFCLLCLGLASSRRIPTWLSVSVSVLGIASWILGRVMSRRLRA
jgi:hypothetical protein